MEGALVLSVRVLRKACNAWIRSTVPARRLGYGTRDGDAYPCTSAGRVNAKQVYQERVHVERVRVNVYVSSAGVQSHGNKRECVTQCVPVS